MFDWKRLLHRLRLLIAGAVDWFAPRAAPPRSAAAKLRNQVEAEQADVKAQVSQSQTNYPL